MRKLPPLRRVTLVAMVPSIMTITALIAGLTAVRHAIHGRWELAVIAVVIAAVIDGMDGPMARMLKASSRFGAELDSLADSINFGVVPALILYLWMLEDVKGWGWAATLTYAVCVVLRLARFNSKLDDENEPRKKLGFFTGIPSPAGAGIALLPMMVSFEFNTQIPRFSSFVVVTTFLAAFLMVSTVSTFSLKKVVLSREAVVPVLAAVALLVVLLVIEPWKVMIGIASLYALSIPLAEYRFRQKKKALNPG